MNNGDFDKRLSAVLAADVAGYTRLMETDSEGTVAAWHMARTNVIDPSIDDHGGRIVKHTGDGFLAEFSTVQAAVECAVSLQTGLIDNPLEFRMGINLGDVFDDGVDIHGEGVNIAARIEALAEEGGVCISGDVYNQVRNRLDYQFEDMGEHEVKHVSAPIRVFRILMASDHNLPKLEGKNPIIPDKPSIAVLPFDNMSGDPEQEYFADGVVEEIIMALSRMPWLFVIARNSSFIYKGRAVDVKQVGRDLGVRYVLEGSLRKAGGKVRISGQLIDASSGAHLWADRYDGDLEDIFELQEQITSSVVGAIAPKLELAEIERSKHKPTSSLDAYDYYLRGMAAFHQWTAEGNEQALDHFYRAIELDMEFANAHGMAARCFNQRLVTNPLNVAAEDVAEAERLARRAADLGRNDAMALCMAGVTLGYAVKDVRGGAALTARALTLNPNLAWAWYSDGWLNIWLGNPDIGLAHLGRAMELSPQDPMIFQMQSGMAHGCFTAGEDDQAWSWSQKALHDRPDSMPALLAAAASAVALGLQTEAMDATSRLLNIVPGFKLSHLTSVIPHQQQQDAERWSESLRKAGLPE